MLKANCQLERNISPLLPVKKFMQPVHIWIFGHTAYFRKKSGHPYISAWGMPQ